MDSLEWITAYLAAHSLSVPSRRYSFFLWFAIAFLFLVFAVLHWTGSRGGWCGAIWSKWSLRRRSWRKQHALALAQQTNQPHRQPVSLPSNAQLLSLSVLTLMSLALAFLGPDYLPPAETIHDVPQHTISKSLWSSSARAGQIAFALLPLCVLFALKAPPFAILAVPFMVQLYFDKLAWLHRWIGRLIWILVSLHVILWSIQLSKDVNPSTGRVAYVYAWSYTPFIYGWIAFVFFTLLILLSLHPIRRHFYEYFYISHVLLAPCTLIMAGLHHPTVAWWCWASLLIWVGERLWRATWWIYANSLLCPPGLNSPPLSFDSGRDTWEMGHVHRASTETTLSRLPGNSRSPSPLADYYLRDEHTHSPSLDPRISRAQLPPSPLNLTGRHIPRTYLSSPYIPPPGYVHAELLSGPAVRLRFITPGFLPWSPGQHFLLNIPSVSWFTSHPFTCASVCDQEAPTDAGRIMVFLVRVKSGWTLDLWNLVSRLVAEQSGGDASPAPAGNLPKHGVLLRANVDGPFGSAKRTRWGNHSTGVIITGGSGVSFGLSLLQYMCMCLAGRDGRHLGGQPGGWGRKGADLKRVRFIWLVREYSHLQWCASIIRWCTSIVPPAALQVDIFVTNFKPIPLNHPSLRVPPRAHAPPELTKFDGELEPPQPNFARESAVRLGLESSESVDSHESHESDVDLSYYLGENLGDEPPPDELLTAHDANILHLTNFDGDVDMASPGDAYLSTRLKKEGRLRRMQSRRLSTMGSTSNHARSSQPPASDEVRTPRHAQGPRQSYLDQLEVPSWSARAPRQEKTSTLSTSRLLSIPASDHPNLSASEMDLYSPLSHRSESLRNAYLPLSSTLVMPNLSSSVRLVTVGSSRSAPPPVEDYHDAKSEPRNLHAAPLTPSTASTSVGNSYSTPTSTLTPGASDSAPSEMDEQEAIDVSVVSEHARPGKPKLDKVIADEVQASKGAIVVACCGPTSLNAMVRKIVAAHIDPGRICRGDMRGSITLVSEEFEY